ncbi:MAG: hypothetical protein P8Y26_16385 [Gemmatimonadales bacterium]
MKTHELRGLRMVGRRVVLPFLAMLAGTAPILHAQQPSIDTPYRWIEKGMRFGISPGYILTNRGSLGLGPGSTPTAAGRFRLRVSNPLSFEVDVTYGNSDRRIVNPYADGGPAVIDTVNSNWLLAEVAVQFTFTGARTWHGVQPYLVFGGGGIFGLGEEVSPLVQELEIEGFVYEIGTAPDFLAAGGVEWLISKTVGLGFETRDHIWRLKAPPEFFVPEVLEAILESGVDAPSESEWTNNIEFSLSVWIYP